MGSSTSKPKKERTPSQIGRWKRQKGDAFERKIADELRQIYDPTELLKATEAARAAKDRKEMTRLRKASCISRGEQRRGAKHPDILCDPCPCWLELQHAEGSGYRPYAKLAQAQKDAEEARSDKLPVAVCKESGSHSIQAAMTVQTLVKLAGAISGVYYGSDGEIGWVGDQVVIMDWEAFKMMLEAHLAAQT